MIIDGFTHQLPDSDPDETSEWLESLDTVIDAEGPGRANFLMAKLIERARAQNVPVPASVSTPYINTIPAEHEAWFPGDEEIEQRIRRFVRWNAAVMVVKANHEAEGIGGHLSTFASSAVLYEVGFNHFFRGKGDGTPGDHVYFQGLVPGPVGQRINKIFQRIAPHLLTKGGPLLPGDLDDGVAHDCQHLVAPEGVAQGLD